MKSQYPKDGEGTAEFTTATGDPVAEVRFDSFYEQHFAFLSKATVESYSTMSVEEKTIYRQYLDLGEKSEQLTKEEQALTNQLFSSPYNRHLQYVPPEAAGAKIEPASKKTEQTAKKWQSLRLPYDSRVKEYSSGTMFKLPKGSQFADFIFFHPNNLVKQGKDGDSMCFDLAYTDEFTFKLKNNGTSVNLSAAEMQRSVDGKIVDREVTPTHFIATDMIENTAFDTQKNTHTIFVKGRNPFIINIEGLRVSEMTEEDRSNYTADWVEGYNSSDSGNTNYATYYADRSRVLRREGLDKSYLEDEQGFKEFVNAQVGTEEKAYLKQRQKWGQEYDTKKRGEASESQYLAEKASGISYEQWLVKHRENFIRSQLPKEMQDTHDDFLRKPLEEQRQLETDNDHAYVNDKKYEKACPYPLRSRKQFVCWQAEWNDKKGKYDKIPINPKTGRPGKSNDSRTWSDFDTACQAVDKYNLAGVGIVLTKGIVGIDIDECMDKDGKISPEAEDIMKKINSYTEVSPSGTGIHILAFADLPDGARRTGNFEMYCDGRFFTLTGNIYKGNFIKMATKAEATAGVAAAHAQYVQRDKPVSRSTTPVERSVTLDDEKILKKLENSKGYGQQFTRLWAGDFSMYAEPGESGHHKADLALCGMVGFYTQDPVQVDRIFRNSGLMRDKWDVVHGQKTYGQMTIDTALSGLTKTYDKNFGKKNRGIPGKKRNPMSRG